MGNNLRAQPRGPPITHHLLCLAPGPRRCGSLCRRPRIGTSERSFRSRYRNPDGQVTGVINVVPDLKWLQDRLGSLPLPERAVAFITDGSGTVLARRPEAGRHVGGVQGTGLQLPMVREIRRTVGRGNNVYRRSRAGDAG
ncbi:protein of unknown function (plasmid) [Rhodovastum atsumiense]|nr:protein of unknown function [Rhodovastum atsumiense]